MNKQSNYELLINKIDEFSRKYYMNKLIRGLLYSTGLILAAFLTVTLLEAFLYANTRVRTFFFYGFLSLSGIVGVFWILMPLLNYFKLGKVISHEQAANMIGNHFTNVKDKLLNILQLKEQSSQFTDSSLIEASINQKIDDIKLVPFSNAINLKKNQQYAKYALVPFLILLSLFLASPDLIRDSANRIVNYDQETEMPAPFHFTVTTEKLEAVQYEDLTINVSVDGTVLPHDAYVHYNNYPFNLKKTSPSDFHYKFNNLQKDVEFYLEANGVRSKKYTIKVIPKPTMLSFDAALDYPNYIDKKDETLRNSGDMVIPAGTKVNWQFQAQNTDDIHIQFNGKGEPNAVKRNGDQLFTYAKTFRKDAPYTIYLSNKELPNADSISYAISVIPDLYPTISAEEMRDSSNNKLLYFLGDASDDYGIKSLLFKYNVEKTGKGNTKSQTEKSEPLEVGVSSKAANFTHFWDLEAMGLGPGDKLTYFFEVWDNDGVNGSKFARTSVMTYELPTTKELDEQVEQQNEETKSDLEELVDDAKELKEEVKELQEKIVQEKEMNWEDKANVEDLLQRHKDMQNKIENMQNEFNQNMEKQEEYKEFSENVKEKRDKLKDLFEKVMTEELKEMMEKLEALMEKMDKEEMMEELEEMEMTDDQLEKELDRMMELFKQLEFEQKMEETIDKLEELAEEEEQLAEETEEKPEGANLDEQEKKQEEINEKFEDIKEDIEKLDEMNEELGNKEDIGEEMEEQEEDISQELQETMEQLEQNNSQEAGKKQKNASKKMQEMAQQMQMMQMMQQQQQQEEDMQAIRQLLENLIKMSFDQEDLMDHIKEASINTPQYVSLVQQQHKLKDDATLIEDSLVALSKRIFQLESFITQELTEINRNMNHALDNLEDRKVNNATTNQQFIMTSVNNLALMLDEAMQQMQQQMAQQMEGNQNCSKPGSKPKPGMMGLRQMQQQLNDKMSKMQGGEKKGKQDGKGKNGSMSKEMAQMAAQQAAIRQALEQMSKEENKDGKGSMGDLEDLAKEMEETETDLVNKKLTSEMMQRQQDILTRLLEAENAQKQREMDNKRLAHTAKQKARKMPPSIEEYLKKREAEIELYKTVPPSLKPYYRDLVEKYFKTISF